MTISKLNATISARYFIITHRRDWRFRFIIQLHWSSVPSAEQQAARLTVKTQDDNGKRGTLNAYACATVSFSDADHSDRYGNETNQHDDVTVVNLVIGNRHMTNSKP